MMGRGTQSTNISARGWIRPQANKHERGSKIRVKANQKTHFTVWRIRS